MNRISAGNNLTIELDAERWRLLANGDGQERLLMEVAAGQPFRYTPGFGTRRRLPDTGALPTQFVQRVVLGWSGKDEAWHLGLLLEPELAEARGSRWCEVAHWPDPERDLYGEIALQAGEGLAQTITRPFNLVPAREEQPLAPPPPAPLPALPAALDQWTLEQPNPTTLQFKLSPSWARARVVRVGWYTLWTVVYIILSLTTLRGRIALPRPEFLPYLGLASAAVLVGIIVYLLYQLLTVTNRIIVDGEARTVRGLHGNRERWRAGAGDIQSIYVSQVVSRKSKREKRTIHYGELNLHLGDQRFRHLLENGQAEEKNALFDDTPVEEQVMLLTPELVTTGLQAAGAHVARLLTLPAWYDQRLK